VAREADDWRLGGNDHLQGVAFTWKPYRAWSQTWEHDHCALCWATFMDPNFSEDHRRFIEEHPDVLTEGYATTSEFKHGAEYDWVCKQCFDDFVDLYQWRVIQPG
jgi:hypothetical protein